MKSMHFWRFEIASRSKKYSKISKSLLVKNRGIFSPFRFTCKAVKTWKLSMATSAYVALTCRRGDPWSLAQKARKTIADIIRAIISKKMMGVNEMTSGFYRHGKKRVKKILSSACHMLADKNEDKSGTCWIFFFLIYFFLILQFLRLFFISFVASAFVCSFFIVFLIEFIIKHKLYNKYRINTLSISGKKYNEYENISNRAAIRFIRVWINVWGKGQKPAIVFFSSFYSISERCTQYSHQLFH